MSKMLPSMGLERILEKVRDEHTWKTYVVVAQDQVIGGCVLREHSLEATQARRPFVELALLAVDSDH